MRVYRILTGCTLAACILVAPTAARTQSLNQPDGWEVRAERFVAMPPGFHITTSPSVLLYHPEARADGEFEVATDGFLFRGDSPDGYGLFVGGRNLEADDAAWISFEIGHDGSWVVRSRSHRGGTHGFVVENLAGPEPGPVALPGDEMTAKNVLRIVAGPDSVEFMVNEETVTTLPRAELEVDGVTGFRVGAGLNLHLISFTVSSDGETTEWAPQPAESPEEGGA